MRHAVASEVAIATVGEIGMGVRESAVSEEVVDARTGSGVEVSAYDEGNLGTAGIFK
jgi:hypothetical protein